MFDVNGLFLLRDEMFIVDPCFFFFFLILCRGRFQKIEDFGKIEVFCE